MRHIILALALITCVASLAWGVPPGFFPPDVQQLMNAVYAQLPSDARMLDRNAIRLLTPDQAQLAIGNMRLKLAQLGLPLYVRLCIIQDQIRQMFRPQLQQTFFNGACGVSEKDRQLYYGVLQLVIGGGGGFSGGPTPGQSPIVGPPPMPPGEFIDMTRRLRCTTPGAAAADPACSRISP